MSQSKSSGTRRVRLAWAAVAIACAVLFAAAVLAGLARVRAILPSPGAASVVVQPTPFVLSAIQDLARLEGASVHLERIVDVTDRQSRFFGLVKSQDAILLVAAVDVTAGVDLSKLRPEDVTVDPASRSARITLPPAEVLSERLDSTRTYVYARTTGLLATRNEQLETLARREAERQAVQAATEAGLLERAGASAARAVESLVRALGYSNVVVSLRSE